MLNYHNITDTDLIAMVAQARDIKRAADRICRFADEVSKRVLLIEGERGNINRSQAEYLNDQLHTIEQTITALRKRFPERHRIRMRIDV